MVRQRIPDCPAGISPGPVRIGAANRSRRAGIWIESQMYQRGSAPSCPGCKTGRRPPVSAEPCRSGARRSACIIARTGNHRNRHGAGQSAPVAPAVQLGQVVAPHQPDEVDIGVAPAQGPQRIDGENGAEFLLNRRWHDRRKPRLLYGRGQARGKRCHACLGLERVARRDQPPHCIKPQRLAGEQADSPVPAMRRVEASAQQADALGNLAQGRICPVPRTSHL